MSKSNSRVNTAKPSETDKNFTSDCQYRAWSH